MLVSSVPHLRRSPCHRLSFGFTLIELLVVIAIIAVLAALLLPVVRSMHEKSNQTKCINQLRTWGQVFALYAADNSMNIQTTDWDKMDYKTDPYFKYWNKNFGYINSFRVCPSDRDGQKALANGASTTASYGFAASGEPKGAPPIFISRFA